MLKILDNTFLAAARGDVHCIDLLRITGEAYQLKITPDVVEENEKRHGRLNLTIYDEYTKSNKFSELYGMLERKNFWIGKGELSAIVCSIYLSEKGEDNYIVTDDGRARDLISHIHDDPDVADILGYAPSEIKLTGTIGLICHLRDKSVLTPDECRKIGKDLDNSTFRIDRQRRNMLDQK